MHSPLVSVIIPIYNGEKWLKRAVDSIVSQPEFSHIELILVNDGSSDGSGKLCDSLQNNLTNIRVYHKENGGVSSARNHGVQHASGKYLCFLDCDDWWEPDFFTADIVNILSESNSADVFQFAYQEVNTFFSLVKKYPVKESIQKYSHPEFGRYDWSHHCSFFFLRKLISDNALAYPISKNFEDGAFVEMVFYCASSYQSINRVVFNYWENPASCVHTSRMLPSLLEHYKAVQQEQLFFAAKGVSFHGDIAWHVANAFPKLCAEVDFNTLSPFMQKYCIDVLDQRPDEHYQPKLWKRIELWRKNPKQCYYYYKFTCGVLWNLKNHFTHLSSTTKMMNYLYSRFYRGFKPI